MKFYFSTRSLKNIPDSILFVTSQLRQREVKLAYALKTLGWKVGLIYYNSTPFQPEKFFDFAWEVHSAKEAYFFAKKLSPRLIHLFSGAIDDYVIQFCKNKIAPVVIDLNDIFTPSLMDYCPERFIPTREVLALADGFCARDLQVKYAEHIDHCQLPPEILFFPEYCWNEPIKNQQKSNQEVHIVSVGTISLETYGMFDCCYLELTKKIIAQGIHLHIYPPWSYRKDYSRKANVNFAKDYAQFLELASQSSFLHIHDSLPVEKLAKELPKYDFGIISGGCKEFGQRFSHFKPTYVESCYSGRISDYLDARLPVLINDEVAFNHWLLKRYGVFIDLKEISQPGFKTKLLALKKDEQLKMNVEHAVEKLSIKTNAPRLAKFYSNIIDANIFNLNQNNVAQSVFKKITQVFSKKIKNTEVASR